MPSLIQAATNSSSSGTSITVTLGGNVTAGNGVVVSVVAGSSLSVSGGSDTFTQAVFSGNTARIFYVLSSAGGYSSVTVSGYPNGAAVYVYEFPPLKALDATHSSTAASTSWSTGSAAGNFADEVFVANAVATWGTSASSITGPSSPWVNEASHLQYSNTQVGISGYLVAAAAAGQAYSGTTAGTGSISTFDGCIASFRFFPSASPSRVNLSQAVKRAAYY